jgi:hypothetical protein
MKFSAFTVIFVLSFWFVIYVLASAAEVNQLVRIILATVISSMFGSLIIIVDAEHAKLLNFDV